MAKYRLRFFFEWMTSECLWTGNDAASEHFTSYPIDYNELPLSDDTKARAKELADWHQGALNWASPGDPGAWRQEECDRFNRASIDLLESIREELGAEFDVVDEYDNHFEDPDLDRYLSDPAGFRRPPVTRNPWWKRLLSTWREMKKATQIVGTLERIRNRESVPKEDVIAALESCGYSSNGDSAAALYVDWVAPILHYHPEWIAEMLQFVLKPLYMIGVQDAELLEWWVKHYLARRSQIDILGEDGRHFLDQELFAHTDELEDAFRRVEAWHVRWFNDPDPMIVTTPAKIYSHLLRRRPDLIGTISESTFTRGLEALRAQDMFAGDPDTYRSWEEVVAAVASAARDVGDK